MTDFDWRKAGNPEDHARRIEELDRTHSLEGSVRHYAAQCIRGLAEENERLDGNVTKIQKQLIHEGRPLFAPADEIERLEAENEALRDALESILEADLRGQGAGYAEAMKRGALALYAHGKEGK